MNFRKARAKLHDFAKIGGKIADVAVHLTTSTTPLGKAAALVGVINAIVGEEKSLVDRFSGCSSLRISRPLSKAIFDILYEHGALLKGVSTSTDCIYTITCGPGKISWVSNHDAGSTSLHGPFLEECEPVEAQQALARLVWESLGTHISLSVQRWGDVVELKADPLHGNASSETSTRLYEEFIKWRKAGIGRSYLFYGVPGSGKSYIMRELADKAGGFSLRHKVEGWGSSDALISAVEFLCPKSVLLDDIDRGSTSCLLDAAELIKSKVQLLMVSANYEEKLDPAIRRPGRFDEAIEVSVLDQSTFDSLTVGLSSDAREKLRPLPAAYINEYALTVKVLGLESAEKKLVELVERAESIAKARLPKEEKVEVKST